MKFPIVVGRFQLTDFVIVMKAIEVFETIEKRNLTRHFGSKPPTPERVLQDRGADCGKVLQLKLKVGRMWGSGAGKVYPGPREDSLRTIISPAAIMAASIADVLMFDYCLLVDDHRRTVVDDKRSYTPTDPRTLRMCINGMTDTIAKEGVTKVQTESDRWLVSCLGVLHLSKGLFYRVVPADQSYSTDYAGVFRFRLWWSGQWVEVLVDDRLPTINGRLAFIQTIHSDQFWPALLEKAYAKLHGSYEALKYGTMLDGLSDLTGGIAESISLRHDPTTCGRLLNNLLDMTTIVTCTVQPPNQPVETISGEGVQLVRLRNPLGTGGGEYVGTWSRGCTNWSQVPHQEKERLGLSHSPEQEFWMSYSEFVKTFTHIEAVHLDSETAKDEPSLHNKQMWQMKLYQGAWIKGVTAGGCRNNPETFHINPQLHLILSEMEEVIISLNQHSIMEPKVIGFTAYSLPKNATETAGKSFFRKNKSLVNSQYSNSRQVSLRWQLEQGGYLVLPTTFETGQESSFTLRVYSSKQLKLKLLDTAPSVLKSAIIKAPATLDNKSFSQYEAVFLQLADEHRTVNSFELQELLDACLPNGIY
ncbi:unnamed protein product [Nezara viridula]|uniref:Calpain catalytic domain-containing protein n=1 Tax=Nezara viridula TaxID=85310 RepID=A0A9P0E714_NEZVI|nr:unnamed protein product [Nezara viridula]